MKLTDYLTDDCVKVPLKGEDRDAVIAELVDLLAARGKISDKQKLLDAVLEREGRRTTGIGAGLAIPHGKCPVCDDLVIAVGKPAEPVDFNSIDGQPVDVVVLLASPPDQTGPHIQALARVSRLMTNPQVRAAVAKAKSAQALYKALKDNEVP